MNIKSNLSRKTFTRTAIVQVAVLSLVLSVLAWNLRNFIRDRFTSQISKHLFSSAQLLSMQVPPQADSNWCTEIGKNLDLWISLISSVDGYMLCDTIYTPGAYPGVLERPEIQMAIQSKDHKGMSVRLSPNFGTTQGIYSTVFLKDKSIVLRVGLPLDQVERDLFVLDRQILFSLIFLALSLCLTLFWTTRSYFFRKAKRAVEEREKILEDNFVANVSHELRTPLTSILGFSETTIKSIEKGDAVQKDHLSIIQSEAHRMLAMVNDLLDLSALSSGVLNLHIEQISTEEISEDAFQKLEVVYRPKNFKIIKKYETDFVWADSAKLMQVLLNFLTNSFKYCDESSEIKLTWRRTTQRNTDWVVLTIEDNGPGLSDFVKQNLFKRFNKHHMPTHKKSGSGLGLAIAHGMVEAHNGTIECETSNNGTCFRLSFPVPANSI